MIDRDMKYMLEKLKHVQQVVYVCAYVYEYMYIVSTCSCGCVQKCIICTHMYGDGGQSLTQNVLFYHFSSVFFFFLYRNLNLKFFYSTRLAILLGQ